MIYRVLISILFSCALALAQATIYGLTATRTQNSDPTGTSCANALEFASYGTKWLSCAGGSWQPIGGAASGLNGQIQFNASGTFGGLTVGGDGILDPGTGTLTITKTNGLLFAPSATIDATNAGNISSGTLNPSRLPGSINGTSVPPNTAADTVLGTTAAALGAWRCTQRRWGWSIRRRASTWCGRRPCRRT